MGIGIGDAGSAAARAEAAVLAARCEAAAAAFVAAGKDRCCARGAPHKPWPRSPHSPLKSFQSRETKRAAWEESRTAAAAVETSGVDWRSAGTGCCYAQIPVREQSLKAEEI